MKDYVTPAPFVEYAADGEIVSAGCQGLAYVTDRIAAGDRVLLAEIPVSPGLRDLGHYVDVPARAVREKTPCPARLDRLTLRDLPVPCRIEIANPDGSSSLYAWSEPALTLAFDHRGTWTVRVLSVAHRPAVFEVPVDD